MSSILDVFSRGFVTSAILFTMYIVGLSVYRLYFHPLSKFPGPKLAAVTKWYEFYYDVILGGRLTFHLEDLHREYGPIVRINPIEVHIIDPDFYEDFYTKLGKQDKFDYMAAYFGNESSIFTTVGHDLHRARRAPVQPLLSRSRIIQLQPLIRGKCMKMLGKIGQYKESERPLAIDQAFMALSEDVVFEFCFGQCNDALDVPDFKNNLHPSFKALTLSGHLAAHIPWIPKIMLSLPEAWMTAIEPAYGAIFKLKKDLANWTDDIKQGRNEAGSKAKHTTIMQAILDSNLPQAEKGTERLRDEAQIFVGAGITTSGWAATVTVFHVINNPTISSKLRRELEEAIPDPTAELDWLKLEKLPYLTACIKEGVRLSVGESNRSPRIYHHPVKYNEWEIPAGTPIAMSSAHVSFNERVFPEPKKFNPERWIDAGRSLDKYTVAFGKGPRSCIGIQLAHSEIYYTIAGLFRLFELELYETDISDVEFQHDYAVPYGRLDSKGVRVKVKSDH